MAFKIGDKVLWVEFELGTPDQIRVWEFSGVITAEPKTEFSSQWYGCKPDGGGTERDVSEQRIFRTHEEMRHLVRDWLESTKRRYAKEFNELLAKYKEPT